MSTIVSSFLFIDPFSTPLIFFKTFVIVFGMCKGLVMCGKIGGTAPNNILADGYPLGNSVIGPITVDTMCINCGSPSTFQFSQLMIWNQALR